MNLLLLRAHVRQGIINCLVMCECRACGPLLHKRQLAKRLFSSCYRVIKCFALGLWEWCLCLLAKSRRHGTEARCLYIVLFCTHSGCEAFEAKGSVGGATKRAIEREGLPVARFGQSILLLLAGQVAKQSFDHSDIPCH